MQVSNAQVNLDRSYSSGRGSSIGDKLGRSVFDRIRSEATTAESLASGLTTAEQLSDTSTQGRASSDKEQSGEKDSVARLGLVDSGSLVDFAGIFTAPIVKIQDRIERLEARLEMASSDLERISIRIPLRVAQAELKAESLKVIENELIARNGVPSPGGYAPGDPIGADTLSRANLETMATGAEDDPVAIAARTILNEPSGFESIAGENITVDLGLGSGAVFEIPATISLDEIQAARFNAELYIDNVAETDDGGGDYEVPDGDDDTIGNTADDVEIGQIAFDAQQNAIEESIRTGEEVKFVNSTGNTVGVTVTATPGNGAASYSVVVREGRETNTFTVNSEIGTENTMAGIANIVDWGSSLTTKNPGVPAYPGTVNFRQESDPEAAANVYGPDNVMTFFDGTSYINKTTYIHELGHVIGYALHDNGSGDERYSPDGWEEVLDGAAGDVSEYTDNAQEQFSEALAAYVNAADHGPEALAEFREAFPDRSAYIESMILGTQEPVVVP